MAITSIMCPVLGAHVTRITDLEGDVSHVICAEYQPPGICKLKKSAFEGGPLTQLIERLAEDTLTSHDIRCVVQP